MFRPVAGFLLVFAGVVSLALAFNGLASGQVFQFAKSGTRMLTLTQNPDGFWFSVVLWFAAGVALAIGGYIKFLRRTS